MEGAVHARDELTTSMEETQCTKKWSSHYRENNPSLNELQGQW